MIRLVALAAAAGLITTACTINTDPSPTDPTSSLPTIPATTTTTTASRQAVEQFNLCLAEHGLAVEPVKLDGQGRPRLDLVMGTLDLLDPDVSAALADCADILTSGAMDLSGVASLQIDVIEILELFSECVRNNGVPEFPDPVPGFTGIGVPFPVAEIPYNDPLLEQAITTCRADIAAG